MTPASTCSAFVEAAATKAKLLPTWSRSAVRPCAIDAASLMLTVSVVGGDGGGGGGGGGVYVRWCPAWLAPTVSTTTARSDPSGMSKNICSAALSIACGVMRCHAASAVHRLEHRDHNLSWICGYIQGKTSSCKYIGNLVTKHVTYREPNA